MDDPDRPPTSGPTGREHPGAMVHVRLPSHGPLRGRPLLDFLAARAIPGLESVVDGRFRRNLPGGWLELALPDDPGAQELELRYQLAPGSPVDVAALVRRVADLDTDLEPITAQLAGDQDLARRFDAVGPSRLPGTFDPFELAVRAIVGQQVSVAAARTLLGRLVSLTCPTPDGQVDAFPSAYAVAAHPLDTLGMPSKRRATIGHLARAVVEDRVQLGTDEPDRLHQQLVALPGIGPWTAGYITMRVRPGGGGDGWPSGDLVLRQSLGTSAPELERRAARWRPWRAYAALVLWRTAGGLQP